MTENTNKRESTKQISVGGVDATLWGPLHMGWSVRYRNRLFSHIDDFDNCWYVPGFGKHGRTNIGATFNIIFDI